MTDAQPPVLTASLAAKLAAVAWNKMAEASGLPQVKFPLSQIRMRKLALRVKEAGSLENWTKIVESIPRSDFLMGKNNLGWRATIDLVCRADKFPAIMEGNYHNQPGSGLAGPAQPRKAVDSGREFILEIARAAKTDRPCLEWLSQQTSSARTFHC
jgi:hypothetical protein